MAEQERTVSDVIVDRLTQWGGVPACTDTAEMESTGCSRLFGPQPATLRSCKPGTRRTRH